MTGSWKRQPRMSHTTQTQWQNHEPGRTTCATPLKHHPHDRITEAAKPRVPHQSHSASHVRATNYSSHCRITSPHTIPSPFPGRIKKPQSHVYEPFDSNPLVMRPWADHDQASMYKALAPRKGTPRHLQIHHGPAQTFRGKTASVPRSTSTQAVSWNNVHVVQKHVNTDSL